MEVDQIQEILKVRECAAEMNGNTTELYLVKQLLVLVEDYKKLKKSKKKLKHKN